MSEWAECGGAFGERGEGGVFRERVVVRSGSVGKAAAAPTWTSTVMGPLLSISRISPFLVPSRMCPCPSVMALMDGLSSRSRPAHNDVLVMSARRPADDVTGGRNLWRRATARLS